MSKIQGAGLKHPLAKAVRQAALGYPKTIEDFPWGHAAFKAEGKKVFLFLGDTEDGGWGCSMKLPFRSAEALKQAFAEPTGYGLAKSGWVSLTFKKADKPNLPQLLDWLDESWRAIAPKKLSATVAAPVLKAPAKKTAATRKPGKKAAKKR